MISRLFPAGFRIGHWTDPVGITGCTVVLCPPSTVGGCDVRGSSPGSRELALLASEKSMEEVHAVLLTGGSAFGLAAADGVMRFLEEHEVGYQTPWVKVPIVPAAVIFDLNIGSVAARPGPEAGYQACVNAGEEVLEGSIGAGTGATVGKWGGAPSRMKGGVGVASMTHNHLIVSALAIVNAVGDVLTETGDVLAGARGPDGRWLAEKEPLRVPQRAGAVQQANTTLVVVMMNSRVAKVDANRIAQRSHDGMARAIKPAHTSFDGDIVFVLSQGQEVGAFDLLAEMSAEVTSEAIRSGVRAASSLGGVPALGDGR